MPELIVVKPSQIAITNHLIGSGLQSSEMETVARNIILYCRGEEDSWDSFTMDDYTAFCDHQVTGAEHEVIAQLTNARYLILDGLGRYRVTDDFIVALWGFVEKNQRTEGV